MLWTIYAEKHTEHWHGDKGSCGDFSGKTEEEALDRFARFSGYASFYEMNDSIDCAFHVVRSDKSRLRMRTVVRGLDVSTVMLPVSWLGEYETMVFDIDSSGYSDLFAQRYDTPKDARAGHWETVRKVRDGILP